MPDREKVIKGLECCIKESDSLYSNPCKGCPYEGKECIDRLKADALALLKEQEAVEPTLIREGRNKYYNDYVCPGCDNELYYGQNYCSECGRKVKWE